MLPYLSHCKKINRYKKTKKGEKGLPPSPLINLKTHKLKNLQTQPSRPLENETTLSQRTTLARHTPSHTDSITSQFLTISHQANSHNRPHTPSTIRHTQDKSAHTHTPRLPAGAKTTPVATARTANLNNLTGNIQFARLRSSNSHTVRIYSQIVTLNHIR
jgi:hypothetical protein